jgi:aminoglycoside phosphotransferase (APT) family kinase protein
VTDLVDEILKRYRFAGPWTELTNTGVVNRVYATREVVVRIATDHPDGVRDARTESIAAPAARAVGVMTPRLIVFDDSRELIDRPFSIWERVDGETLGLLAAESTPRKDTWASVGRQLAILHTRLKSCPDPDGYLDEHPRRYDLRDLLDALLSRQRIDKRLASRTRALIEEMDPFVRTQGADCFLHNDLQPMNIMCTAQGELLAIIDWGDAGWGDPTRDFAAIPLEAIPFVLEGYSPDAPGLLGSASHARMMWDKLRAAMVARVRSPDSFLPVEQIREHLDSGGKTRA